MRGVLVVRCVTFFLVWINGGAGVISAFQGIHGTTSTATTQRPSLGPSTVFIRQTQQQRAGATGNNGTTATVSAADEETEFFEDNLQHVIVDDITESESSSLVSHLDDDDVVFVDPDRIRRRSLLLAALGTASASRFAIVTPPPAAAASRAGESTPATATTLAQADGEAGGGEDDNDSSSASSPSAFDVVGSIIKPPMDDREYLTYSLPNGLRVLLCSDPSSIEAAAAMDVHVGATSDPAEVPGMAHFTEHMLFLGTQKYPKEDSFESFLSSNGGASNAYTDTENTVYYFDIEAEADDKLAEGLDRFGSFFSGPLFSKSATGRELNAIESENSKNLQTDSFRIFQIAKSRANPEHPFSKFFTGNKKTLLDDTKARGINLRQELIKFYNTYYSANQMTLAVAAPQSIDKLRMMVDRAFSDVPNREIEKPEKAWDMIVPPFALNSDSAIPSFGHVVQVVPVQDLRQVTISWPVAFQSEQDRRDALLVKPVNYVAHLLGHEGPRSLVSYLKRRGWVTSLAAASEESLSDFETFDVAVGLTTQGLEVVDDVVEAIYSYLSLLRDREIPDYVFEEVLWLDELQWRFLPKSSPSSYVQSLSTAMQLYPPRLYVAGPRRLALEDFMSPEAPLTGDARTTFASKGQLERTRNLVGKCVNSLKVDNSLVTVMSKNFKGQTDRTEKWYGTEFSAKPIPSSALEKWRNCQRPGKLKIDFPKPNEFVPSEQGLRVKKRPPAGTAEELLRKRTFESRMEPVPPPVVIRDDGPGGKWTVYYKQDDRFGQPKAYVVFQVLTQDVYATRFRAFLSLLYEICVTDKLGEYAYDAELAGLTYDVKVLPRGVRLTFGGYNDKLMQFASYVARKLSNGLGDILPKNEEDFDRYKDQVVRSLSTFDVKQPYAHASYYAQLTLEPIRFMYSNSELRDAAEQASLSDLVGYANGVWSSGKGEALVQGNFDKVEALQLVDAIADALPFRPIPESDYPSQLTALPLPEGSSKALPTRLLVTEPNPFNENTVSHVTLQSLGESEKDHVLLELISAIVKEPMYNELRTKKQLGYIVSSGIRGIGNTRTLAFIVQSSVAAADKLTIEIFKFLDSVEDQLLQKLSKADLAVYAKSLIDRKTEPDKTLATEVTRNWAEIASGRLQFDRVQREAAALLEIDKNDLLGFWRKLYSADGRRVLITEIIPRQGVASSQVPPKSTGYEEGDLSTEGLVLGVDDIQQFRKDREGLVEAVQV